MRVDAHRLDVDAGSVHELDFFVLVDEVLEVRLMLEIVRVEFLVVQREVRLDVVVELDDLQVDALFREERLRLLEDLSVRHGRRADFQRLRARGRRDRRARGRRRFRLVAAAARESEHGERKRREDGKQFLH